MAKLKLNRDNIWDAYDHRINPADPPEVSMPKISKKELWDRYDATKSQRSKAKLAYVGQQLEEKRLEKEREAALTRYFISTLRSDEDVAADLEKAKGAASDARAKLNRAKSYKFLSDMAYSMSDPDHFRFDRSPTNTSGVENEISQLEKELGDAEAKVKQYEDEAWIAKMYREYESLRLNEDFEENSAYKMKRDDAVYGKGIEEHYNPLMNTYGSAGYEDLTYEFINKNPDAIKIMENRRQNSDDPLSLTGHFDSEEHQMTDDEIKLYNYVYATRGQKAADGYLDMIRSELYARERKKAEEQAALYAKDNKLAASIGSILTSPTKGLAFAGQALDYLDDGKIDPNASYNRFAYVPKATREAVSENWGPVGSFAYQTAMSMGDFLVAAGLSAGSGLSMAIIGSSAAADTTMDALDRGVSSDRALLLGVGAGVIEAVTEKFSIDKLLENFAEKGAKNFIISNVLSEASEEAISEVSNTIADVILSEDKSYWSQAVQKYKEQGYSENEANWRALLEKGGDTILSALGGAISGGIMAGGKVAIGKTGQAIANAPERAERLEGQEILRQALAQQRAKQGSIEKENVNAETRLPTAMELEQDAARKRGDVFDFGTERPYSSDAMTAEQLAQEQALTKKIAAAATMTEKTGLRHGASMKQIRQAAAIGKVLGREIQFYTQSSADGATVQNGIMDKESGTIYVNVNSKQILPQIVAHELTHSLEDVTEGSAYNQLKDFVKTQIQNEGGSYEDAVAGLKDLYARAGTVLNNTDAEFEVVAKYVESQLLTNAGALKQIAKAKPSVARRLGVTMNKLLAKLVRAGRANADLKNAAEAIRKAYDESGIRSGAEEAVTASAAAQGESLAREAKESAAETKKAPAEAETVVDDSMPEEDRAEALEVDEEAEEDAALDEEAAEEVTFEDIGEESTEEVAEERQAEKESAATSKASEGELADTRYDTVPEAEAYMAEAEEAYEAGDMTEEEFAAAQEYYEEWRTTGRDPSTTGDGWGEAARQRKREKKEARRAKRKGLQFSFSYVRNDGIEVYKTSKEVLSLPWKQRKNKYLSYILQEYRGRTARFNRNGHVYYATFDLSNASKAIYGDNRSDDAGRDALINTGADGNIFDLVENAAYDYSSKDRKNHQNTDYFDYFVKTVQIDDKVFDLVADVKKQYYKDGGYTYTIKLVENEKVKASPKQRGQALLKNSGNALTDTSISDSDREVNPDNENVTKLQHSISYTVDNRPVAVIPEDILAGVEEADWRKTARKVMAKRFPNGIAVNGANIKVNQTTRREFTKSEYSERLRRKKKEVFADKMRLAGSLDDVVIASTDWLKDGSLTHERNDNFVDFSHGNVLLQIGQNQYKADVVVGYTNQGEAVLYDVVRIYPDSFEIKEEGITGHQVNEKNPSPDISNSFDTSISSSTEEVNPDSENVTKLQHSISRIDSYGEEITDNLTDKAEEMLVSVENRLGSQLDQIFGLRIKRKENGLRSDSYNALIENTVRPIIREYLETGRVKGSTLQSVFESLYQPKDGRNEASRRNRAAQGLKDAVNEMTYKASQIRRVVNEKAEKASSGEAKAKRTEEVPGTDVYAALEEARIRRQNAENDNLLTEGDRTLIHQLLTGEADPSKADELAPSARAVYDARKAEADAEIEVQAYEAENGAKAKQAGEAKGKKELDVTFEELSVAAKRELQKIEKRITEAAAEALGLKKRFNGAEGFDRVGYDKFLKEFTAEAIRPITMEYLRTGTVTTKTVNEIFEKYYDPATSPMKDYSKSMFSKAIDDQWDGMRVVREAAREDLARIEKIMEAKALTPEKIRDMHRSLASARREEAKVVRHNFITEGDKRLIGEVLRGAKDEAVLAHATHSERARAIYKAKKATRDAAKEVAEYKSLVKEAQNAAVRASLGDVTKWSDKAMGFLYQRETLERIFYDICPDKATAQQMIREYAVPVHTAEAESKRYKDQLKKRVLDLGISTKVKKGDTVSESFAVQLYGEAMDNIKMIEASRGKILVRDGHTLEEWKNLVENLWTESPGLDKAKIEAAVQGFRVIYNELFEKMNDVRIRNGYAPIEYRQGYFPHFTSEEETLLAKFGRALGVKTENMKLPTTINGMTGNFKPGIRWFGHAQQRKGFHTTYDAITGFEQYVNGAADVIFHTDNIQRLRTLATQIRYLAGDEGIKAQIDSTLANESMDEEQKEIQLEKIRADGRYALSGFVSYLDEYTNVLAGKKSKLDRGVEEMFGRRIYVFVKNMENRVAANMIAGNLGSALTNFIPLNQAGAQLGWDWMLKGMKQTMNAIGKDDGIWAESTFLTNRKGYDPIVKSWSDKLSDVASIPMELVDSFTAGSIVRGAYAKYLAEGLSAEEALYQADLFAASVMADRSKGAMPTIFASKNPLVKLVTQFQLEVNNEFSVIFKDIPRMERKRWTDALAMVLLKYFFGAFLYNELYELVVGRRAALDPIGILVDTAEDVAEGKDAFDTITAFSETTLENLPFVGGILGGGRVPISSALPDLPRTLQAFTDSDWSAKKKLNVLGSELSSPLFYMVPPFGGGVLKKIWQTTAAIAQGGRYTMSNDGQRMLQYPVYSDTAGEGVLNWMRGTAFGLTSLPTGRDWVEGGFGSISAKETAVYEALSDTDVGQKAAFGLITDLREAEKTEDMSEAQVERQILRDSEISGEGKSIVYYGMLAAEKEQELMKTLDDLGANMGEVTDLLMNVKDASSTAEKLQLIKGAELKEDEKRLAYEALVSSENGEDMQAFENAGMNTSTYLDVLIKQAELKADKSLDGGQRDTEFARWVNKKGLTDKQRDVISECITNFTNDTKYDDYLAIGLDDKDAYRLNSAMEALEPLEGKSQVTDLQKYRAVIDNIASPTEQKAALSTVMSEKEYEKLTTAADSYGVEPEVYVSFKETLVDFDLDGNGKYKQEEVEAAIRSMSGNLTAGEKLLIQLSGGTMPGITYLTDEQMAALWQLVDPSWSPKNNPFDKEVGAAVQAAFGK